MTCPGYVLCEELNGDVLILRGGLPQRFQACFFELDPLHHHFDTM